MQIGMADEMAQIAANTTTRCAFHSVGKTNGGDQHEPAATVPLNGEGGDCDRIRQLVSVWEAKAQIGGSAPTAASDGLINGTLGSPSATLSIHGRTLPPTPPAFGGVIKESAKNSTPWWPPRVVPPKGAPNVLLILTDDQGYGVSSTFGGVIPTPLWIGSLMRGCATPSSTQPHSAHRPARR